jgi:hypothetical protein
LYTFGRNVSATNFEKLYGVPDKLKNGTIVWLINLTSSYTVKRFEIKILKKHLQSHTN